ncbi:TIGR02391 family protein [Chitinophaga sp.]|uniref:TIGR02391 family protein n=1 Tax=Chitinophaga sp. TaxID=1869181 RepID=UPI0031D36AF2
MKRFLADSRIDDIDNGNTKWLRLYNAFAKWQNDNQCSNHILQFIQYALHPSRYINKRELYTERLHEINKRLAFLGIELAENGLFRIVDKATKLSEAEERSNAFKYRLQNRNVHENVFKYCNAELLVDNYFHSVFEAVKSIADRLRSMTGLYADGNALVDTAFSTTNPLVRINRLTTDTDRSEHIGLMNLIKVYSD